MKFLLMLLLFLYLLLSLFLSLSLPLWSKALSRYYILLFFSLLVMYCNETYNDVKGAG